MIGTRLFATLATALVVVASGCAPDPSAAAARWRPEPGLSWQWQLSGQLDPGISADVFDVDGQQTKRSQVKRLKARGARVICYFDAGAWEAYRSDADDFPAEVKGRGVSGWPAERWLDIRRLDVLLPIMERRIRKCDRAGFDAVEPDLVDGYTNPTGFPLTAADQLKYNRAIARIAHSMGLSVGLKNNPEQAAKLEPYFDFAVVEQCVQYNECKAYLPFVDAGKAVFHAEYSVSYKRTCAAQRRYGFSSIVKRLNLGPWVRSCG